MKRKGGEEGELDERRTRSVWKWEGPLSICVFHPHPSHVFPLEVSWTLKSNGLTQDYLRETNDSDRQRETYLASYYVTWQQDPSLPSTQACSWCLHTCSLAMLPREQLLIHLNADSPVYLENLFRINFPLGGRECILEQSVKKTNSCPVWCIHQQNRVHADSPCLCSSLQARR